MGMDRRQKARDAQKLIWRMSEAHPQGEIVRVSVRRPADARAPEVHDRSFCASSLDLLGGADVTETAMDALPGELIDAFAQSVPARVDDDAAARKRQRG